MAINPQEIELHMQRFERACREAGVKLTHQRQEVFREVAQTGDHPDAEAVYQGVRERVRTISLDTVYRALWMLTDVGLITTLGPPRQRARFDANLDRHHHFVCVKCGLTRDFFSDDLDGLKLPRSVGTVGRVETIHVEVRGVCQECADADRDTRPETKGEDQTSDNPKGRGAEKDE